MSASAVDLARCSVFFDFDGTMTLGDVGVHLLERTNAPGWEAFDDEYAAGRIGSRECIAAQWKLLPQDEAALRQLAREVPVDPAAAPLVAGLKGAGAEVTIVSDGWGFYIADALAGMDVPVLSNSIDFTTGTVVYPDLPPSCPCRECGTCKRVPVEDARARGRTAVFVGDGTSDRKAAAVADAVFAKGALADWCAANGVAHTRIATLANVQEALGL